MSRQREYQKRHKAKGLCSQCSNPTRQNHTLCESCRKKNTKPNQGIYRCSLCKQLGHTKSTCPNTAFYHPTEFPNPNPGAPGPSDQTLDPRLDQARAREQRQKTQRIQMPPEARQDPQPPLHPTQDPSSASPAPPEAKAGQPLQIRVLRNGPQRLAVLENTPHTGTGYTTAQAIGDLILSNPALFNAQITEAKAID